MFIQPKPTPITQYSTYQQIAEFIQGKMKCSPKIGVVLGSGLSGAADAFSIDTFLDYQNIPGWPTTTVEGHPGKLILAQDEGKDILIMKGRVHFLEGYSMSVVTLPTRVMRCLGIENLILTNSAGGLSDQIETGDIMLISDHINLPGLAGWDPLRGQNIDEFGPRYPDMSVVYDQDLRQIAREVASETGIKIKEGKYICTLGPCFLTPSDLNILRLFGADAVGMSTIPEAIVGRHAGLRILGISCITDTNEDVAHENVLKIGAEMSTRLGQLIKGFVAKLKMGLD
jgi:purine-nucleoside phosphorylase